MGDPFSKEAEGQSAPCEVLVDKYSVLIASPLLANHCRCPSRNGTGEQYGIATNSQRGARCLEVVEVTTNRKMPDPGLLTERQSLTWSMEFPP